MDAAGAVDAQTAPTAPWNTTPRFSTSAHRHHGFGKDGRPRTPARLRAGEESDDTQRPYRVAGFQTFFSGRIQTSGDIERARVVCAMTQPASIARAHVTAPFRSMATNCAPTGLRLAGIWGSSRWWSASGRGPSSTIASPTDIRNRSTTSGDHLRRKHCQPEERRTSPTLSFWSVHRRSRRFRRCPRAVSVSLHPSIICGRDSAR